MTAPPHRLGGHTVHPGGPGALVAPHPKPRHQKERGIGNKVVQIVEPAVRITDRPTVQFGLDLQYPAFHVEERGSSASVFTNDLLAFQHPRCWFAGPLRHVDAFPSSDYYGSSPPPRAFGGRCAYPAPGLEDRFRERHAMVPTFTA